MVASTISLGFLVMHSRCWPFKDDNKNLLKLGAEVALMMVFLCTALLRSVNNKKCARLQPPCPLVCTRYAQDNGMVTARARGGGAARGACSQRTALSLRAVLC